MTIWWHALILRIIIEGSVFRELNGEMWRKEDVVIRISGVDSALWMNRGRIVGTIKNIELSSEEELSGGGGG